MGDDDYMELGDSEWVPVAEGFKNRFTGEILEWEEYENEFGEGSETGRIE